MHMIFCRNVLIYFDKPTQAKRAVAASCDCLRARRLSVLGHSEIRIAASTCRCARSPTPSSSKV